MGFKSISYTRIPPFNTEVSQKFLDFYTDCWKEDVQASCAKHSSKSIAPSSFRCLRKSWFRLRGTSPDILPSPDITLDFTAAVGTSCHQNIQQRLKKHLQDKWISVSDYFSIVPPKYEYTLTQLGLETAIEVKSPPIRFSCDGIILWNDVFYLLEIKTSEYTSFKDLCTYKEEHLDQVKLYSTLLGIDHILFLYQDRMYGDLKCFEYVMRSYDVSEVNSKIEKLMKCVELNIAPPKLPTGDKWCNNCPYKIKCSQW